MKTAGRIFFVMLFLIYIACVGYLCFGHISGPSNLPDQLWNIPIDKCVHFTMFLPYTILATLAFARKRYWSVLVWAILSGLLLAFSLELLQSVLTDYRTTDPWDLVANISAITTGGVIMALAGLFRRH